MTVAEIMQAYLVDRVITFGELQERLLSEHGVVVESKKFPKIEPMEVNKNEI